MGQKAKPVVQGCESGAKSLSTNAKTNLSFSGKIDAILCLLRKKPENFCAPIRTVGTTSFQVNNAGLLICDESGLATISTWISLIMPNAININTPIGMLRITGSNAITGLEWGAKVDSPPSSLLAEAKRQIDAYFRGELREFDLPLSPRGTPFQCEIWERLRSIPYGKTMTYGSLSKRQRTSARAVGGACGANPIPLIIPCHRIVGQNGQLTGYSGRGGIQTKHQLLLLEKRSLEECRRTC